MVVEMLFVAVEGFEEHFDAWHEVVAVYETNIITNHDPAVQTDEEVAVETCS